jgi:hypothetical protein
MKNIFPFEEREEWEEQWPDFETITYDNAAIRFRQYNELTEYIEKVGINWMKGNDIRRYSAGNNAWSIKFMLGEECIYFDCSWTTYFRSEYDRGDQWNFTLPYNIFCMEESEILALGANQKEQQLLKEKQAEAERRKKEAEQAVIKAKEYRRQEYERLKKEFEE